MSFLEQAIRRYEHRRWTADDNRRVLPFGWGLEHIGGRPNEHDPRAFVHRWADETIAGSDAWFATSPADDYRFDGHQLSFTSAIETPHAQNNIVRARFFQAKHSGPAVVVLPNWNAKADNHVPICRWLNALGISALRLVLPYHEERNAPGHERADFLVGPNIGLTILANRQAVTDVRRCLRWLEQMGYGKLGILGTSIGSSIAFITMCHDRAIRAGVFLHVSTYFGDVVRTGMTTSHVWEGLRGTVSGDELRHFWSPISPFPYIQRVHGTGQRALMITGKYDPTFLPELSEEIIGSLHSNGVHHEVLRLPCGHYSLGEFPFSWAAGGRFAAFFFQYLT